MKTLKTIIIDDEYLARLELKALLNDFPSIDIVGEASSIDETLELLARVKPQLILLDIQLGGETGFELLEKVHKNFHVIFVTAYDQYAIKAFEVNALDYLLKPVHPNRLKEAIDRVNQVLTPTDELKKFDYSDHLFVTTKETSRFIPLNKISHIISEGDYSVIHTVEKKRYTILKTMKKWENELPNSHFMRIHRANIVNISFIERVEKYFNNTSRVYMKDNESILEMSRRYGAALKNKME